MPDRVQPARDLRIPLMASITTSLRKKQDPSRRSPLDLLGGAALIWAGAFLALAFALVAWLR
jgi:hypothetical protein